MNQMNNDLATRKKEVRNGILAARRSADVNQMAVDSGIIQSRISGLPEFKSASVVFCYLSTDSEVATNLIVSICHSEGKTLCVPAYDHAACRYMPFVMRAGMRACAGKLGIAEPVERLVIDPWSIDIAVIPGVGFDTACNRLGHGGGHYDRMLAEGVRPDLCKVGAAFDYQVMAAVPAGQCDIAMDIVVTEKRIIRAGKAVRGGE